MSTDQSSFNATMCGDTDSSCWLFASVPPEVVRARIRTLHREYSTQLTNRALRNDILPKLSIPVRMRSNAGSSGLNHLRTIGSRTRTSRLSERSLPYHSKFWICLSFIFNNSLRNEQTITLRELYYNLPVFTDVKGLYAIVKDITGVLRIPRHNLFVEGSPRGQAIGHLIITSEAGLVSNFQEQAQLIVSDMVSDFSRMQSTARMIIVVEKEAVFSRLAALQLHRRMQAILITGRGMPGYLTRRFVRVVQDRLSIPAYGIVDYNPHGASIMLTYKLGSLAAGHESEIYAANILYTGLFWSDIATLKIAETSLKSMTALDFKVANNLLLDPFVIDNPAYAKVITDMIENKVKAELEALNQVEFDFVLKYIQHKILAQQAI